MSTHAISPLALGAPGDNLGAYISHVNQLPILSAEEEHALALRYHDDQDVDAARRLVLSHLRFVVHIARTYAGYGLPQGDLIQEGNVGLMKAVKRFDPSMGVRLVSFAVHWIKAEIHEYVIRNWRIVKIATTKAQRKLFFNLRSLRSNAGALTHEEASSIAETLKVSVEDVHEMQSRLGSPDTPLELSSDEDEDSGRVAPIMYLEDHEGDPLTILEAENTEEVGQESLYAALEGLDDRARLILQRRWLDAEKATLHELADELGVSAERVRQLEKAAMEKLKKRMHDVINA